MVNRSLITRQSNQGHTRKQPHAGSVCQERGVLSTRSIGIQFRAENIPQLPLQNYLNTNIKWELASLFSLAGTCAYPVSVYASCLRS